MNPLLPMHAENSNRPPHPHLNRTVIVMMTLQVFQSIVLAVTLCILISLAPEISKTLSDVSVVLPEMRITVLKLGKLLPEVERGMNTLDQICVALNLNC